MIRNKQPTPGMFAGMVMVPLPVPTMLIVWAVVVLFLLAVATYSAPTAQAMTGVAEAPTPKVIVFCVVS